MHLITLAACLFSVQNPPVPKIPETLIHDPGVVYSTVGGRMEMDVVRPRNAAGAPAVVLIHGGGFRRGNRQSQLPLAVKLAERGYVAAAVTYRLSPRNQFPAPVHDVKAAVRFLRANAVRFNLDGSRVCAWGGSAGGHLALMLGLTAGVAEFEGSGPNQDQPSSVNCVVNYYGPTDFTQSYAKSVDAAEVLPLFLGGNLELARAAHIKASPLNWVTPAAAPVLSVHGTQDAYVAYEHSVWLTSRLLDAGVAAEIETLSGAGHGFRGADAERAEARGFAFLEKHLAGKPQKRILVSDHGPGGEILALEWPSGRVLWRVPNQRGHDVQWLENGHVLFTIGPSRKVVELGPDRREVWSYSEGLQHPLAAQRLPNGNTLIGDPVAGKVIEVTPARQVVWTYESPDIGKMRMRNSKRTAAGTTLIAIEAVSKIIEVDQAGKIIWTWQAPNGENRRAYQAIRLENGNTMVSLSDPGEVVEVDRSGKVVRSVGGTNPSLQMGWASGIKPLANGGILISDYTGRRLVEVDAKGNVVNELRTGPWTIASVETIDRW